MTMVEVKDDKNVKDKAPDDAKHALATRTATSRKRRARQKTNLDKESEGKADASKESNDTTSAEIGGPDDKIRQLEETEVDDRQAHQGDRSLGREGSRQGRDQGRGRRQRRERHGRQARRACCRCAASAVAARSPSRARRQEDGQARACPASTRNMAFNDYERIMGKEKVDEERQVAARKMSSEEGPLGAQARRDQELARELRPRRSPRQPDRAQDARASVRALRRAHAPPHPRAVGLWLPRGSRQQGRGLSAQRSRTCGSTSRSR